MDGGVNNKSMSTKLWSASTNFFTNALAQFEGSDRERKKENRNGHLKGFLIGKRLLHEKIKKKTSQNDVA